MNQLEPCLYTPSAIFRRNALAVVRIGEIPILTTGLYELDNIKEAMGVITSPKITELGYMLGLHGEPNIGKMDGYEVLNGDVAGVCDLDEDGELGDLRYITLGLGYFKAIEVATIISKNL